MELTQTNNLEAPVVEFLRLLQLHSVPKGLLDYLDEPEPSKAPGDVMDFLYAVGGITPEVLEQLGHDSASVREFLGRCHSALSGLKVHENDREESRTRRERIEQIRINVTARLEAMGIFPGQGVLSDSDGGSTAGRNALTRPNDLKAKLQSEEHKDPRSKDWINAPGVDETRALYRHIMKRLIRGQVVLVSSIPSRLDPDGSRLAWLTACPFLLLRTPDDELLAMPDRGMGSKDILEWGGREIDLWEYPGWTRDEGVSPEAGTRWGRDLDEHVRKFVLREAEEGRHPSNRQIAYYINTSVAREDRRAVSVAAVKRSIKRLTDAGALVQLKYADRYRCNHAWVNIPAQYGSPRKHTPIAPVGETINPRLARRISQLVQEQSWAA